MGKSFCEGVVVRRGMTFCRSKKNEILSENACLGDYLCSTENGGTMLCRDKAVPRLCTSGKNGGCPFFFREGMAALTLYGAGFSGDSRLILRCFSTLEEKNIIPQAVYCSDLAVTFVVSDEEADRGKACLCSLFSFFDGD